MSRRVAWTVWPLTSTRGRRFGMRSSQIAFGLLLALASIGVNFKPVAAASQPAPNILFIFIDDAGIDQWKLFGYGGTTPAATPNLDAIAKAGIKFHNVWAMPACSNSRAALFTGRYPFRTQRFNRDWQ